MALYASDGTPRVTVVNGNTFVGAQAPDGSLNVVIQDGTTFTGRIHKSGALNVVQAFSAVGGPNHSSGAMNVSPVSNYAPGSIKVTDIVSGLLPRRQVATRAKISTNLNPATAQAMSKSFHYNRSGADLTRLGVRLPNWYSIQSQTQNNELGSGGSCTFEASVEYPIGGARKRLTFNGADSITVADGADVDTDIITLDTPIPNGQRFEIYVYRSGMTQMPYWTSKFSSAGDYDQMLYGASVTNAVISGTLTSSTGSPCYSPSAIFAPSNTKASFLWGDSRIMGTNDTADSTGDIGEVARNIGPTVPYINGGVGSTRIMHFIVGTNSKRIALARDFCTSEICNYAINDLGGGQTAAQIKTNLETGHALFTGIKKFQTTCYVSSTGAWTLADGTDQTTATYNAARLTHNANVIAGLTGLDGFFDSTSAVALGGLDSSGKFKAPGYTADGLHLSQTGTLAIQSLNAINTAVL